MHELHVCLHAAACTAPVSYSTSRCLPFAGRNCHAPAKGHGTTHSAIAVSWLAQKRGQRLVVRALSSRRHACSCVASCKCHAACISLPLALSLSLRRVTRDVRSWAPGSARAPACRPPSAPHRVLRHRAGPAWQLVARPVPSLLGLGLGGGAWEVCWPSDKISRARHGERARAGTIRSGIRGVCGLAFARATIAGAAAPVRAPRACAVAAAFTSAFTA